MQRTTVDFGIDLGTTNSTIAVIHETDAKVIPNSGGSGITPSAVWIDKRGKLHVGFEAKQHALVDDQDNGDLEFKLRMGLGAEGKKSFIRAGRELLPEELSAEVLKSLKMDVQTSMGEQVRSAVITVPAAFELPQTNATQKAAELAGLGRCPLLLEPVAASLAYGFQTERDNVYWLVYDFGGGTFDAAIMRVRDGLIQVVNHDGDNHLGGKLIDWDIVTKRLIPAVTSQFNLPEFRRGNPKWRNAIGKMKYHAELAKIEVCRTKAPQDVWVEGLCQDADGKTVDFAYTLTPADVQQVSLPYIEQSLALCRKTLKDKGLTGNSLERILMVGGSTLNPWVRDAVQAAVGSKLEFGIDPVTVVARGAAIFASTQPLVTPAAQVPKGTWRIQIEHEPVGNTTDPDIGGKVIALDGHSCKGMTIEFVDTKTQWRSGRMSLNAEGVFLTQLFADEKRRCEFSIHLCDPTGNRLPSSPEKVVYTLGVVPDKPPAVHTIGIGLANDEMRAYIKKGSKLPARGTDDLRTTVALRAGSTDEVRIPVLEGENARATRNHHVGTVSIRAASIRRDLPAGSELNVTVLMDESQDVRVQVFVPVLDEEFEAKFEHRMQRDSIAELAEEIKQQKARLAEAREKAERTKALKADEALSRIEDQDIVDQVDSLLEAAPQDVDARTRLDRCVRDLAAAIDEVEDSVEWPAMLEKAEASRLDAEKLVTQFGDTADRNRLHALEEQMKRAIDGGDHDLVRQCTEEFDGLWFRVAERQASFHVTRFNHLIERLQSMRDVGQAEQLVAQGRRAINNNDVDALKAANRQLISMLPRSEQEKLDKRVGDVV